MNYELSTKKMLSFFRKIFIFLIPVLLYMVAIALIDPYNMFSTQLLDDEQKKNTAFRLNYTLWKYVEYDKEPKSNILLGDSRMALLHNETVELLTGAQVYNFSFGGGTLPEIIETFWYADKKTKLERVFIGINFELYNGREKKNRCTEAKNVLNNKGLYFINQSVTNSSALILKNLLTNKNEVVGKPRDREKFWAQQLVTADKSMYKDYLYPTDFYNELKKIAAHCNTKNIQLAFVILPTHTDLQNQIIASGREQEFNRFVQDMETLGKVYNFHKISTLTANKENYGDPFHFKSEVGEQVIKYIFDIETANDNVLTVTDSATLNE